jgi:hypothetical protein
MNATANKLAYLSENERLLEKCRAKGIEVRSFDGWKEAGRWVKRGQKQKAFRVQAGSYRAGTDPITGEDRYEAKMVLCYGFTKDQTN